MQNNTRGKWENDLGRIIFQRGSPPGGSPSLKVGLLLNQTDVTATRVPGGPEAGQALAFRRPSVTAPAVSLAGVPRGPKEGANVAVRGVAARDRLGATTVIHGGT